MSFVFHHLWILFFCCGFWIAFAGTSLHLPFNTSIAFTQFSGLANASAFTVEFWAASTNPPHDMACALHIGVGKGGKFLDYWVMNIGDVTSLLVVGLKPDVTQYACDREWHHYAGTFGPDGQVLFYVDGELLMNQTMPYQPFPSDPVAICIGQEADDYLGGFDPTQAYQGYFDEIRLWKVRRSQTEIRASMRLMLAENTPGLAVQWHFDDIENAGVATSAQGVNLTFGSATSIPNLPCDPFDIPFRSIFVPPVWESPVPSVSVAYSAGSRVQLPICLVNCTTDSRYSKVSLISPYPSAGQLIVNGAVIGPTVLPFDLTSTSVVEYSSSTTAFAGDTVHYRASYISGTTEVIFGEGLVTLRKDTAPTASSTKETAKENTNATIALPRFDSEGDPMIAIIESLPTRGQLYQVVGGKATEPITKVKTQVTNPGCGVIFVPESNMVGSPYSSFNFSIIQRNLSPCNVTLSSAIATVDIELVPIDIPPVLRSSLQATTTEGVSVYLDINATDANLQPVSMVLSKPPTLGTLYMEGKPITSILPAVNLTEQWVQKVLRFSSEYPGYNAFHLEGPPSRSTYGDSDETWSASTADGECKSRGTDIFYTEFIEVQFEIAVYAKEVHVMQNTNPGTLTRILAPWPSSVNASNPWYTLWYGPAVEFNGEQVYTITAPSLCNTPFPVNVLRLEFDTCLVSGWNLIDAIRLVGTVDRSSGQTVLPTRLRYDPWSLVQGPPTVVFTFIITHCLGVTLLNSNQFTYNITVIAVNDPPTPVPPAPLAASQSTPLPIFLNATDPDSNVSSLTAILITLPSRGILSLTAEGSASASSLQIQARIPILTPVYYIPVQSNTRPLCGSEFIDTFTYIVSDGQKNSMEQGTVTINRMNCTSCPAPYLLDAGVCRRCPLGTHYDDKMDGSDATCEPDERAFPTWAIIVIIVVGGTFLLLLLILFVYRSCHRARIHMNAEAILRTAPSGNVTMIFTDIQDSTSLWDSMPDQMQAALDIHNGIMRQAILRYGGYEVSTSGDSFFIVFADPAAALLFALEVQNEMLYATWPHELLDYEGCRLSLASDGRQILWQGLRVRMGMHIGYPSPEANLDTQRVDYFGPPVNLAARVSSKACGGQILLSETMYEWFVDHGDKEKWVIVDFGEHKLKGIEKREHIYSILPNHLSERTFPQPQDLVCLRCKGPVWCLRCDGEQQQNIIGGGGSSKQGLSPKAAHRRSRRSTYLHSHNESQSTPDHEQSSVGSQDRQERERAAAGNPTIHGFTPNPEAPSRLSVQR